MAVRERRERRERRESREGVCLYRPLILSARKLEFGLLVTIFRRAVSADICLNVCRGAARVPVGTPEFITTRFW